MRAETVARTSASGISVTVAPRWSANATRPSRDSIRSASRTGISDRPERLGERTQPQPFAGRELAGDDLLAQLLVGVAALRLRNAHSYRISHSVPVGHRP